MLSDFTNHNAQQITSHTLEAISFLVPGSTDKVISTSINNTFRHAVTLTREYILSGTMATSGIHSASVIKEKPLTRSILQNHLGEYFYNQNNVEINNYKISTTIISSNTASLITQKAIEALNQIVQTIETDLRRHVTATGNLNITLDVSAEQTAYRNLSTLLNTNTALEITMAREKLIECSFEYSVNISGVLIRIIGYWWNSIMVKFNKE